MQINFGTINNYGCSNEEYHKIESEIYVLNRKKIKNFSLFLIFLYIAIILKRLIIQFILGKQSNLLYILIPFFILSSCLIFPTKL